MNLIVVCDPRRQLTQHGLGIRSRADADVGPLLYRSLRFEEYIFKVTQHQNVGTINRPNNYDYSRITEQKILPGKRHQ